MNGTASTAEHERSSSPRPAAAGAGTPASIAYEQEIRIAVVMYGGVSLAIYINGVAQELLRLVRATAAREPGSAEPLLRDDQLTGVERLYREFGCLLGGEGLDAAEALRRGQIRTRFVVDVLSGTSAGGINGIFLACALARHQTMDQLKQLWISEGDLQKLLNDAGSVGDLDRRLPTPKKPLSLLNSRRMYLKLLDALEGMKGTAPLRAGGQSALVDELDLFVTATDLRGLVVKLRLADQLVYERRYRNVFRFVHATEHGAGTIRNDFERGNNGFLAFAARCTSSFPAAFEPMTLAQGTELLGALANDPEVIAALESWPKFYRDYQDPHDVPGRERDPRPGPFASRPFGDGGYLDNKPFSHAISALRHRRTDLPMARKLFYVEPSPEHPELDRDSDEPPDALQNVVLAAGTLPRQETIREDLESLLDRNRQIEYVNRATRSVGIDFHLPSDDETVERKNHWGSKWLCEVVSVAPSGGLPPYGGAYGAYHRLRVSEVTGEMAELIALVIGLDPATDEGVAVRYVLSAWRQTRYLADPDPNFPGVVPENQFLAAFDLSYRLRRLRFVQDRLQMFLKNDRHCDEVLAMTEPRLAEEKPEDCVQAAADRRRSKLWSGRPGAERLEVRASLHESLRALAAVQVRLRSAGLALRKRGPGNPLHAAIAEIGFTWDDLKQVMRAPDAEARIAAARRALALEADGRIPTPLPERLRKLNALADGMAKDLSATFEAASAQVEAALHPRHAPDGLSRLGRKVRHSLWLHYRRFDYFDMVLFPMIAGTNLGELQVVDVLRISPEDAPRLVAERDPDTHRMRCPKLAGTRLGHFGAFLDPLWRRSDILWGRLDGAERIVGGLAPTDGTPAGARRPLPAPLEDLLGRLQSEIVREELEKLDPETARRVFVEALLHTRSNLPDYDGLDAMLRKILDRLEDPAMRATLAPDRVRSTYTTCFELHRTLDRERQLRLAARGTQILGRMLDGLSERYALIHRWMAAWMVGTGRVLTGFVEVALPRSVWELLGVYWLALLYGLEAVLVIGGQFIPDGRPLQRLGLLMLLVTYAADLGRLIVAGYVRNVRWRFAVWGVAIVALATFLVGAARIGEQLGETLDSLEASSRLTTDLGIVVVLVIVVLVNRAIHGFLLKRRA